MTPSERSFLTAVIRFQTLLHAGAAKSDPEFYHLRSFLGSDAPDAIREADDRRTYRRFPAQLGATVRFGARSSTCTVVDLGGGGLRLTVPEPLGVVVGSSLLLSVQTRPSVERVDLALEVRCVGPGATWLGCEFVGAPLTLRQSATAPRLDAQAKTQELRAVA
ncbi:MAG: PilZ domain-containing protein [Nannocystaceae bacterium]|nr:PilZ domain-containing protein [bacterium]